MTIKKVISSYLKEILLLVPFIGYSLLYVYELGYLSYFNISGELIDTSFNEYFGVIILIIFLITTLLTVFYFIFKLLVECILLLGRKVSLLGKTSSVVCYVLVRYGIPLVPAIYYYNLIINNDLLTFIWVSFTILIFGAIAFWDFSMISAFLENRKQSSPNESPLDYNTFLNDINPVFYLNSGIIYYCCLVMGSYSLGFGNARKQKFFEGLNNCNEIILYHFNGYLITTECGLKTKQYRLSKLEKISESDSVERNIYSKCECK